MDIERTMQFILEQQAASEARFARFEENLEASHAKSKAELEEWKAESRLKFEEFRKQDQLLQAAQMKQLDTVNRLVDSIVELRESQKETKERVDALVTVVDGLVRKQK